MLTVEGLTAMKVIDVQLKEGDEVSSMKILASVETQNRACPPPKVKLGELTMTTEPAIDHDPSEGIVLPRVKMMKPPFVVVWTNCPPEIRTPSIISNSAAWATDPTAIPSPPENPT